MRDEPLLLLWRVVAVVERTWRTDEDDCSKKNPRCSLKPAPDPLPNRSSVFFHHGSFSRKDVGSLENHKFKFLLVLRLQVCDDECFVQRIRQKTMRRQSAAVVPLAVRTDSTPASSDATACAHTPHNTDGQPSPTLHHVLYSPTLTHFFPTSDRLNLGWTAAASRGTPLKLACGCRLRPGHTGVLLPRKLLKNVCANFLYVHHHLLPRTLTSTFTTSPTDHFSINCCLG